MRNPEGHQSGSLRIVVGAWCLVLLAAGWEVIWALALTEAGGLARPGWAITGFAIVIASLIMLTLALRTLPLGSACTVWVGVGAVGVALTGIIAFGDKTTLARLLSLASIITGIAGLKLLGG